MKSRVEKTKTEIFPDHHTSIGRKILAIFVLYETKQQQKKYYQEFNVQH